MISTLLSLLSSDPYIIGAFSVVLVSMTSFVGALMFICSKTILRSVLPYLVSISVGALLGDAFLHIFPESFAEAAYPSFVGVFALVGFFGFLLLEHGLHWHHSHGEEDESTHDHGTHIGGVITIADSIHNALDGAIIALGFLTSIPIGIATTIAVILHEIPQEIGDMGLLLYIGWSKRKALIFNFISGLFAVLGFVFVMVMHGYTNVFEQYLPYILAMAGGGFVYIAGADLIPELRRNHRAHFVKHIMVIILGVVAMASLLLFE